MKKAIAAAAESYREEISGFVRDIVSIPSLAGQEGPVVERLRQEMLQIGYEDVHVDGMGNLIGRLGNGERTIALDGHCDVVDIGNPDIWEVDPYGGELKDGVIWGRGAADQKGGLAAAIYAGKILREVGLPGTISLYVVASISEEEIEGANWNYIIKEGAIVPEVVLLTEPSNLKISVGQRGRMEMRVKTQGISCHGSAPDRGENAIYRMAPIIQDVERFHRGMESDSILGGGSITVTDIKSTAPCLCAVADSATIHLDRRLTEGETLESAVREIEELPSVRESGAEVFVPEYEVTTHTGLVYPAKAYYPPWLMDETDPVVQTAVRAYREQFGEEPTIGTWQFSTNGVTTKGVYDIPTIGFGPGAEEHAHMPLDQVRVDDLVRAMEFYTAFVLKY